MFREIPNRAASDALVGYGYQVDLTMLRWLNLRDSETLELECGEDIDTLVDVSRDGKEEFIRRLEQVKVLKGRITLKSPSGVVAFLANSVFHDLSNQNLDLRFLFTTNTLIGKERPSLLPNGVPGLQAWNLLREGHLDSDQATAILSGIRSTLQSQSRPEHVSNEVWSTYCHFLDESTEEALRSFVFRTEWGTALTEPMAMPAKLMDLLVQLGHCRDAKHAKQMYNCMFVYVFRTLTSTPPRRLESHEIAQFAKLPAISTDDRGVMELIQSARMERLGQRVDVVEERVTSIELQMRKRALGDPGITLDGLPMLDLAKWATTLPPRVAPAVERNSTIVDLQRQMGGTRWLNLHGGPGTGKTQLLIELCRQLDSCVWWASMRNQTADEAESLIRNLVRARLPVLERTEGDACIVLDDLPIIDATHGLGEVVAVLADSMRQHELLLTSTYGNIPTGIIERVQSGSPADVAVPPFTHNETAELLRSHGAPQDLITELDPRLLTLTTQGNPVLLMAVVKLLASRNWRLGEEGIVGLLSELEIGEFTDQMGVKILNELEDEGTRELLYRLALISGEFEEAQVEVVSETVEPRIDRARERLLRVLGLWIERRSGARLSVSPLLVPVAKRLLPDKRQLAVYAALASDALSRPLHSVFDVLKAVGYYLQAGLGEKAVLVLIKAIDYTIKLEPDSLRLLLAVAEGPAVKSLDLAVPMEVYLLGQKFRARGDLGDDVSPLTRDVCAVLSKVEDGDAWVLPMLAINSLPGIANADFALATQLVEEALRHLDDVQGLLPEEEELNATDLGAALVWGLAIGVSSPETLRTWMDLLARCPGEVRDAALAFPEAEMGLSGTMDSVVHGVNSEPSSWKDLEEVLEHAQRLSEGQGLGILDGCAARSLFILHSEVTGNASKALADATTWLGKTGILPEAEYALRDAVARYLLDNGQKEEGIACLTNATQLPIDAFPLLRWSAFIRLAASLHELHDTIESSLLESALSIARRNPTMCAPFSEIRALGELGIAAWLKGDSREAFQHLESAVAGLLHSQKDNPDWKATFVLMGHALGFITADVALQAPSQTLADGQPYSSPRIGHFLNSREELPQLYKADRIPVVLYLVSMLADGVGNRDSAEAWALEALEQARETGVLEVLGTSAHATLVPLLASDAVSEAVDVALESALALITRQCLDREEYPALEPVRDLPQVISALPKEKRADAELQAIADGALLAFLRAARRKFADTDGASAMVSEIISTCEAIRTTASNQEAWEMASQILRAAIPEQGRAEELLDLAHAASEKGYTCLQAMAYLGYGLTPNAKLRDTAVAQTLASFYVFQRTTENPALFAITVTQFLQAFWSKAIDEQRFRFRTPALAKKEFDAAMIAHKGRRAQAILSVALRYLGTSLPNEATEELAWLADR